MPAKSYFMALTLTGFAVAASAFLLRHASHSKQAQQHKEDLSTWEGEGGKPALPGAAPVHAG